MCDTTQLHTHKQFTHRYYKFAFFSHWFFAWQNTKKFENADRSVLAYIFNGNIMVAGNVGRMLYGNFISYVKAKVSFRKSHSKFIECISLFLTRRALLPFLCVCVCALFYFSLITSCDLFAVYIYM